MKNRIVLTPFSFIYPIILILFSNLSFAQRSSPGLQLSLSESYHQNSLEYNYYYFVTSSIDSVWVIDIDIPPVEDYRDPEWGGNSYIKLQYRTTSDSDWNWFFVKPPYYSADERIKDVLQADLIIPPSDTVFFRLKSTMQLQYLTDYYDGDYPIEFLFRTVKESERIPFMEKTLYSSLIGRPIYFVSPADSIYSIYIDESNCCSWSTLDYKVNSKGKWDTFSDQPLQEYLINLNAQDTLFLRSVTFDPYNLVSKHVGEQMLLSINFAQIKLNTPSNGAFIELRGPGNELYFSYLGELESTAKAKFSLSQEMTDSFYITDIADNNLTLHYSFFDSLLNLNSIDYAEPTQIFWTVFDSDQSAIDTSFFEVVRYKEFNEATCCQVGEKYLLISTHGIESQFIDTGGFGFFDLNLQQQVINIGDALDNSGVSLPPVRLLNGYYMLGGGLYGEVGFYRMTSELSSDASTRLTRGHDLVLENSHGSLGYFKLETDRLLYAQHLNEQPQILYTLTSSGSAAFSNNRTLLNSGEFLYITIENPDLNNRGIIYQAKKDGSALTTFFEFPSDYPVAYPNHLIELDNSKDWFYGLGNVPFRIKKDGSSLEYLQNQSSYGKVYSEGKLILSNDGEEMYFISKGDNPKLYKISTEPFGYEIALDVLPRQIHPNKGIIVDDQLYALGGIDKLYRISLQSNQIDSTNITRLEFDYHDPWYDYGPSHLTLISYQNPSFSSINRFEITDDTFEFEIEFDDGHMEILDLGIVISEKPEPSAYIDETMSIEYESRRVSFNLNISEISKNIRAFAVTNDTVIYSENLSSQIRSANQKKSNDITIYPNPTSEHLKVDFPNSNYQNFGVRMFNTSGKKVLGHENLSVNQPIDVSSLISGLYIMQVIVPQGEPFFSRIVIDRK